MYEGREIVLQYRPVRSGRIGSHAAAELNFEITAVRPIVPPRGADAKLGAALMHDEREVSIVSIHARSDLFGWNRIGHHARVIGSCGSSDGTSEWTRWVIEAHANEVFAFVFDAQITLRELGLPVPIGQLERDNVFTPTVRGELVRRRYTFLLIHQRASPDMGLPLFCGLESSQAARLFSNSAGL